MLLRSSGELSASKSTSAQLDLQKEEEADSPEAKVMTAIRAEKRLRSEEAEASSTAKARQDSGNGSVEDVFTAESADDRLSKKAKTETEPSEKVSQDKPPLGCSTPPSQNDLLERWKSCEKSQRDPPRMHVFLQEGWQDRWCRCDKVSPSHSATSSLHSICLS